MNLRPGALTLLVVAIGSLATAALAHASIGFVLALRVGGFAYSDHPHGGLAPVLLVAALFLGIVLSRAATAAAQRQHLDAVALIAWHFRRASLVKVVPSLAAGGLSVLIAMESAEQYFAFGHPTGVADALGGNVVVGLSIVAMAAAVLASLGGLALRALVATTVEIVLVLVTWVSACRSLNATRAITRTRRVHPRGSLGVTVARTHGLRAPPRIA